MIKTPLTIVFSVCANLRYWAGLCKEDMVLLLSFGDEKLLQATMFLAKAEKTTKHPRLTDAGEDSEDEEHH